LLEKYRAIIHGDKTFPEKLEIIFLDKSEIASQYQGELLQTAASSDPVILQFIESLWQNEFNQLTLYFIEEGKKMGYIDEQLSQEAILAYLEILRKGIRAIPGSLTNRANKPAFARDLVFLIHYGLMGKIDKQQ
jgi:hypothetical protein